MEIDAVRVLSKKFVIVVFIFTAMLIFVFQGTVRAAFFDLPAVGARASGTGGAMTGLANDTLSAVYYNPAALPDVEGDNLVVGATAVRFRARYKSPQGYDEKNNQIGVVPNAAFSSDRFKPIFFGIGMYGTLGVGFDYDADSDHNISHKFESNTGNMYLSPTIGYKLNDKISCGMGFNITYCKIDMGTPTPSNDTLEIDADGFCFGVNLGVLYKPFEWLNLGLRWRSPMKADLKGDADFSGVEDDVTAHMYWPHTLTFGIGLHITPKLTMLLDLEWIDYSDFSEKSHLDYKNLNFLDSPFLPGMKDAGRLHVGCEYLLNETIALRAGYLYNPRCAPVTQMSPLVTANTFHTLHLGLGWKIKNFTLDMTIQRAWTSNQIVPYTESGYPGIYETPCTAVDIDLTYHF